MENALLRMNHITKTFYGVKALDDVSFELRTGEVHGLMGANGAGKSTLMKVLAGVYLPDSGTEEIDGQPVAMKGEVAKAQKEGVSMVFQELNILPHLSVLENIFIGNEITRHGLYDWNAMKKRARALLEEVDVDIDLNQRADEVSIAKQQMIEIVRALNLETKIIILDEPTSSLNVKETETLFLLMKKLKEKGIGMIYITHRMDEVYRICDRITLMRDGKIIFTDEIANVDNDRLLKGIVGKEDTNQFPEKPSKENIWDTIFEVRNLSYGKYYQDISFTLKDGEILGFAGLEGAGRTELAKTIFGYYRPDSGDMMFKGKPLVVKSPEDAVRQGIGYVSEDRKGEGILAVRSIRENMSLASMSRLCRNGVINAKMEKQEVNDLFSRLMVKASGMEMAISGLSGGNQQKVCLGKWIMMQPGLLILNEPTRGIDVGARADFYKIINDLVKNHIGIIVISSEEDELIGLCNRIIVMREGRIAAELDESDQNLKSDIMKAMMGI